MKPTCPHCSLESSLSDPRTRIVKTGFFRRKSDSRWVQRFRCLICKKYFSRATSHPCYRQNKRQVNTRLFRLLCSGVSLRRSAKLLHLSRTTVARKLIFLGSQAKIELEYRNKCFPLAQTIEFDDQETFEHTKFKPLSITLAVEFKTRRILGFEVSRMPAKGLLAHRAFKKYGPRRDERAQGRERLFRKIKDLVHAQALIKSDQNPHYIADVRRHFPLATHEAHPGQRGSIVGQGELKKIRHDPLFSLNHTCAMIRANMNRMFRKTWCTTKIPQSLSNHLAIYAIYHNFTLINTS